MNTQGYDTFEAVLTKSDGEKVRGLGYTDWTYISQTGGVERYKAGFVSYSGEPYYGASDYGTAKISEYIEESDPEEWGLKYAFELKLKEEVWADHYIAFGRYVTYAVDGYRITYISAENTPENYITELGICTITTKTKSYTTRTSARSSKNPAIRWRRVRIMKS